MYDSIMSEEVDMNVENEEDAGVKVEHVNCSDAFNTSQLFASRDEVLYWDRSVTHDIGFVAVIMRSDTNTGVRGRTSFLLIACKRSVLGGEGWMVKLICGVHNHEMTKSLVGHSYAGRLTKDKKIVVADMTKSMVKLRNILLMLKEHNANSYTTIKQIYNAKHAYPSSIRGSNTEMQQLMILLDAVKLTNSCNLIFLIDSTYKTNRYKLSLLDIVGVTPTGMTFSTAFAYLEGERLNNVIQALQSFRGLLIRVDALPGVIITDRDLSLMNAVKTLFLEATNLLCRFHIDKNVKAKCKTLVAQKNAWGLCDGGLGEFG
ncbi:PKS-NRPS hybrid synthetase [Glycine max]|nr:PKS-NRPS hybrid synthetase [Glycine max]